MSDVEKKSETQEAAPKKKPYNLREKKEKKAAYRSLIRAELADELYDKILNIVVVQKKYKDPNYSAKDLAKELKTNTRYLSAVAFSYCRFAGDIFVICIHARRNLCPSSYYR